MPSLKTFRLRIRSVQSTQKITKAMKMVAAAKLRRAQEQAMAARPYAEAMDKILASLASELQGRHRPAPAGRHRLRQGPSADRRHRRPRPVRRLQQLDRARGAADDPRAARPRARRSRCWLRRPQGRDQLRRDYAGLIVETITELGRLRLSLRRRAEGDGRGSWRCSTAGEFDVAIGGLQPLQVGDDPDRHRQQLIPPPAPEAVETAAPGHAGRRGLRVRARRGRDPGRPAAAQPHRPDLPRASGERRRASSARR